MHNENYITILYLLIQWHTYMTGKIKQVRLVWTIADYWEAKKCVNETYWKYTYGRTSSSALNFCKCIRLFIVESVYHPVCVYIYVYINICYFCGNGNNLFFSVLRSAIYQCWRKVLLLFLIILIYIYIKEIQPLNYCCIFCINVHYALSFPI